MIRLALIGAGKIACDQHVPAIAASDAFTVAATVDPHRGIAGVPNFADLASLMRGGLDIEAVAICTPPVPRYAIARQAIAEGAHVLLEKPPAATLSQVAALSAAADARAVSLFAAWHSREAAGVAPARAWLAGRIVIGGRVRWREDIRRWHPGQDWILDAGGYGVFDPGINALSILTAILPVPLIVSEAALQIPVGRGAPIAAQLALAAGEAAIVADFDFRQTGPQSWTIEIDTDAGTLTLDEGGRVLRLPGMAEHVGTNAEYSRLYGRFAQLIEQRQSDVATAPLRLVADAFLIARTTQTDPFIL